MAKATKKSGSSGSKAKSAGGAKAKASGGGKSAAGAKKKSGPVGLAVPVQPDDALSAVIGNKAVPRTQMIKKIWDYIRSKGLQDQKDKRSINCDAAMAALFNGKKKVTMFEIAGMLNKHVSAVE